MFNDDQFTKYVNDRFPAIGSTRRRKGEKVEPPKASFVLLAQVEPNSDERNNPTDQATRPYSEAA